MGEQSTPTLPVLENGADLHPSIIRPIGQLTALRDWATDSRNYLKHRYHISAREKTKAYDALGQYRRQLNDRLEYFQANPDASAGLLIAEMGAFLNRQVHMNRVALFYEFPPYRLPGIMAQDVESVSVNFEVVGNDLANVLFANDQCFATMLPPGEWPDFNGLCLIHYRPNRRTPRSFKIGWFKGVGDSLLTLHYQSPRLLKKLPDWSIPVGEVVQVFNIHSLNRNVE